ncbi:MAG: hypothetical protein JRI59_02610 [Deltaproteobacteria bacterium]|nr:hypothetical protein [Deltaproteobacteria bacterium]
MNRKACRKEKGAETRRRPGAGWVAALGLTVLVTGCCAHPGIFQKVEKSLQTVQSYYEPLLSEDLMNERVRRAVVAADTTLLLAAELQKQWCPAEAAVEQLELQAEVARKLAQEAGVQAAAGQPLESKKPVVP